MKRASSSSAKVLLAGVLALFLAPAAGAPGPATCGNACLELVVRQFPEVVELARYRLPSGGRFALSFIHSVSQTPVTDAYRVEEGRIVQESETFMTHEAGLPSQVEEPGGLAWEHRDGRFILHLERPIPHLVMRTDRRYRNRLHLPEHVVDLNQWPDQALELRVEPCRPGG